MQPLHFAPTTGLPGRNLLPSRLHSNQQTNPYIEGYVAQDSFCVLSAMFAVRC